MLGHGVEFPAMPAEAANLGEGVRYVFDVQRMLVHLGKVEEVSFESLYKAHS
jgi:hypothetical protein